MTTSKQVRRPGRIDLFEPTPAPAPAPPRLAIGTAEHQTPTPAELALARHDLLCEDGIAQIVHDMKNPLTTIALESTLIEYRLAAGDYINTAHVVRRINHNVLYLDRMIQDLLDVTSIRSGRFALSCRLTELAALIESVADRAVPSRDQSRVFIECPEHVHAVIDDLRIERVLSNLLDNALKYTPSSSGIVVRLTRVGDRARICVTDAGPGMSADELHHVFEPYQRASTSYGRSGSGLGLFVAKQIVEAHGGTIGVESVRDIGTRFVVTVPATMRSPHEA